MIEEVKSYKNDNGETLKNLLSNESVIVNHVVMEPGLSFPPHMTEHDVNIIIISGSISISLDEGEASEYTAGNMVSFPKGIISALSNPCDGITELFVVKTTSP